jgi:opacity protein-like surface antigen
MYSMRKLIMLALLTLVAATTALAQTGSGTGSGGGGTVTTATTGPEVFVGYSNLQAEGLPNEDQTSTFSDRLFGQRTGLHGLTSELTGYFTPRFGLTGDFSYNQRNRNFDNINTGGTTNGTGSLRTRVIQFLGGPTVRFPTTGRLTPFLHALAGVANTKFEAESQTVLTTGTVTRSFETSSTDFAMALGGGLDVQVNERVGIRAFQFDYNPIFLRSRSLNVLASAGAVQAGRLESKRQDNLRLSFGVTIK